MMMHLAVLIVLLHSFVPHHHHEQASATTECISIKQEQHSDIMDLLGNLFHTDLGADHLENLQTSPGQQVGLDISQDFQSIVPYPGHLPFVRFLALAFIETTFAFSDCLQARIAIPRAPPHRVQLF